MLRVILVDDEPFIIQGLKVLLDWKSEGFEIVGTFKNGREAYDYLKEESVDLIIADIKMPTMTGLDLLKAIREENISDAYFVLLTGYQEFTYAQIALRYDCMDYILKPVEKNQLLSVLRKINKASIENQEENRSRSEMETAYLARHVISILCGKFDDEDVDYVKSHMKLSGGIRYIDVECERFREGQHGEDEDDSELRRLQKKLYEACREYLKDDDNHAIFDVSLNRNSYDVGLIFCGYMPVKSEMNDKEYLEDMRKFLEKAVSRTVCMFVGKNVSEISRLSQSFSSAFVLKSLESFHARKNIYEYESEVHINQSGFVLCKKGVDDLIDAISTGDTENMPIIVENLFGEMKEKGLSPETVNLNINYFLFQLIHIASELDSELDQEEILRFIGEHSSEEGIMRGSISHLTKFACEYSDYLAQLRKNASGGLLLDVEREIHENYAQNLTLRELGKKYFVNSSYLGQAFQKKYNMSFKDYLTSFRISCAEKLLINTDMRIAEIAEEVGYKDSDYFLKKFIEANGCTPSKYRKSHT